MADCPGVKLFQHPKETIVTELTRQGGWIVVVGYLFYQLISK